MVARGQPATEAAFELGEGPLWDAERGVLRWVDIIAGAVLEGTLDAGVVTITDRRLFEGTVGAVALGPEGRVVVAGQERLVVVEVDGAVTPGPRVVPAGADRRCNDAAVDPAGRLLVGTLSLGDPTGREVLVRWEDDGSLTTIDDDLGLSNGIAWSTDGRRLFSVDSQRTTVFARDYDATSGEVGERCAHIVLEDGVEPDGIAVDAEDHLWVAVWGGGEVRRFSPDGTEQDTLQVGPPHTSNIAFAGPDLCTAVVTTARDGLDEHGLREFPASGRLFTTTVDVPGTPVTSWNGRALPPRD